MQDIKTADWSQEVAPFWGAVIKSALSTEGFSGLFKAGWTTIKVRHTQTMLHRIACLDAAPGSLTKCAHRHNTSAQKYVLQQTQRTGCN